MCDMLVNVGFMLPASLFPISNDKSVRGFGYKTYSLDYHFGTLFFMVVLGRIFLLSKIGLLYGVLLSIKNRFLYCDMSLLRFGVRITDLLVSPL